MKRSLVLSAVAIVLLAVFAGPGILLLLVVLPVAWFFINRREQAEPENPLTVYADMAEVQARYGEPDDVVVLNATRAGELGSMILIYHQPDVAIVAGRELALSDITGVAAKNLATPYTVDEWALILNTRQRACPTITLRVDYDGGHASELAAQLDAHLTRK